MNNQPTENQESSHWEEMKEPPSSQLQHGDFCHSSETQPPSFATALVPLEHDVICGRGRKVTQHPGNRHLYALVEANRETYKASSKTRKTQISSDIVRSIHSRGGRFLRLDPDDGSYSLADTAFAREKVSHALRSPASRRSTTRRPSVTPSTSQKSQDLLRVQQQIFQNLVKEDDEEQEGQSYEK